MRLYRLTLRGIGPFPGEQVVDFERLGASGLFLLEGPTGAGKSTVIDAVTFALYGKVAGSQASDDRMRSDFADSEIAPFVQLDFETGSGLYRVRRTPKYERAKRRGRGTITQHATAKLWRLTSPDAAPADDAIATTTQEVGDEVLQAVGLTREQFVRTVVLPQGEFATFLRAPAEERRVLLQKLFGTEVYEQVKVRLEDRRRAAGRQRETAAADIRTSVAALAATLGLADAAAAELATLVDDPAALRVEVDARTAAAAVTAAALQRDSERAAAHAARALAQLSAAQQHEHRRQAKLRLLDERRSLAEADVDHRRRSAALASAQRAARVCPSLTAVQQVAGRVEICQAELATARANLPAELRGTDPPTWSSAHLERLEGVARLAALVELEAGLPTRDEQLKLAQREVDFKQGRLGELQRRVDAAPQQIERLKEQSAATAVREAMLGGARTDLDRATNRLAGAEAVVELAKQATATERLVAAARCEAEAAGQTVGRLWRRHLDGLAGELASELVDGEPCPVCGSGEHPDPAGRADDVVTRDDVAAAEQHRDQKAAGLAAAAADLTDAKERLAHAQAAAGGLTVAQARLAREACAAAVTDAEEAMRALPALRHDLEAATQALADDRQAVTQLRTDLEHERTAIHERSQQVEADRGRVATERGDDVDVAHRVSRLQGEAEVLAGAIHAAESLSSVTQNLDEREADARRVAAQNGFTTPRAAEAAWLEPAEVDTLDRLVRAHDNEVIRVETLLGATDLADVDVDDVRDLGPLESAEQDARRSGDTAREKYQESDLRRRDSTARARAVHTALDNGAEVVATTAPVIRMADLVAAASADNARGWTLPAFVLFERFGEVVGEANLQLAAMSDGRYRLEHVTDKEGGRRSGLGLVVHDQHTEKVRPTGTLSGGETFYCSLALALGLANVVTAEAGGVDLGTLFVDEGFGTLDPQTLDNVLDVLGRLRTGGRTVGIVSHVAGLKDRISERVEIRRCADGSSRLEVHA